MKLLIAYDGSDCANAALADLRRAGLPREAEAVVLSAADVWLPPDPVNEPALVPSPPALRDVHRKARAALEEAQALANAGRERVLADFPVWRVTAEARADAPAWAVIKAAETWKADLIVVGSQGRTALNRLVMGSVSHQVVTEARCSVRVARGRARPATAPVKLLIGVDGSPDARHAVQTVAGRGWPADGVARVVVVIDPKFWTEVPPLLRALPHPARAFAEKIAEESVQTLRAAGLQTAALIVEGDPKRILPAEAEREDVDCVFVGARGLGHVERFLLGSVSTVLAMRAPCSVEIIRPPAP